MIDVQYLRHSGTDLDIVNAAKVSFDAESGWENTCTCSGVSLCTLDCLDLKLSAKDEGLLGFLARGMKTADFNQMVEQIMASEDRTEVVNLLRQFRSTPLHKSPFNHAFATFRVKAPIFVARQLVKHEYMPWNEVSRRYVEGDLEWYFPEPGDWRSQPENVKQGSGAAVADIDAFWIDQNYKRLIDLSEEVYYDAIARGLSREQARMFLPQSLMTEWVWSGSLYAIAKMCQLRLDAHAQAEARYVAEKIDVTMADLFPVSWESLKKHGAN